MTDNNNEEKILAGGVIDAETQLNQEPQPKAQPMGEYTVRFKGRKPEEGDVLIRSKKRYRQKGEVVSGASKMRAAYKTRIAKKGAKSKKR